MDLNETMHAAPMSTVNHKNNVLVLLLLHRGAVKPIESEGINKYTVILRFVLYF